MSILSRRSALFALAGLWLALLVPAAARAAAPHDAASPGTVELD
jgi:hypothetical protein